MSDGMLQRFVRMTLKRPVTVLMLLASTVLLGVIALAGLPVELLPSGFVMTNVSIDIPFPNANPIEVEEQVTKPTEEVLRQIAGLESLRTTSSKDRARISIDFGKGVDPDEAFAEVRDLMEVAKLSWPSEVQEYTTFRFNLDTDLPIIQFGILLDGWESDTAFLIDEKVVKELESVDGVARVVTMGIVQDSIRIFVDREKARASGISLFEVAQALGADNRDVVGGKVEESGQSFHLRSLGRFRNVAEIEDYPVRPELRLKDIAEVTTALSFRDSVFRLNGKQSVWFMVNKEAGANTVDVCRRVRRKLDEKIVRDARLIEKGWDWFRPVQRDFGHVIETALSDLVRSALIGGLLAILPLFLFLRRVRMTLIIALAIPISLMIALACLYFEGDSLNVLTMMGITIAIGMLVDNSIVVVENIFRHRMLGESPYAAALAGTAEVALAVTLSTATTLVVFLPLIFMDVGAEVSFFTKAIGLPVCWSVLASLVVALVFIPLGTVVFYPGKDNGGENDLGMLEAAAARLGLRRGRPGRRLALLPALLLAPLLPLHALSAHTARFMHAIESSHRRVLTFSLRHRFAALLIAALGCGLISWGASGRISLDAFSEENGKFVQVDLKLESNYTLKDANEVFQDYWNRLKERQEDIGFEYCYCFYRNTGGSFYLSIKGDDRQATGRAIKLIESILPAVPGVKRSIGVENQNEDKTNVRLNVKGPDLTRISEICDDLSEKLEALPGVLSVRGGIDRASDEIVVEPDRQRMQLFSVDPRALMGTIAYGIRGQRLPDFQAGDEKVPLIIEFSDAEESTVADLAGFSVWSRTGAQMPLSNLASISYRRGYGMIQKVNGELSTMLKIEPSQGQFPEVSEAVSKLARSYSLPPGYSFESRTETDSAKEKAEIMRTLLLSLVLVLLVMGLLFESVLLPMAVFTTIPFSLLGAWWLLSFTRTFMDPVGMIGAFVLFGVVVNNGIVYLDCAQQLVASGLPPRRALVDAAGMRLRAISMTTATTVVGLVPMALTESSGSFVSYQTLARVVIGGMTASTLAALVIVPITHSLLVELRRSFFWTIRRLSGRLGARSGRAARSGFALATGETAAHEVVPVPMGADDPDLRPDPLD